MVRTKFPTSMLCNKLTLKEFKFLIISTMLSNAKWLFPVYSNWAGLHVNKHK